MSVVGNTALAVDFDDCEPAVCAIKMPVRERTLPREAREHAVNPCEVTRTPDFRLTYKRLCNELSKLSDAELSEFERQLEHYATTGLKGSRFRKYLALFDEPRRTSSRPI